MLASAGNVSRTSQKQCHVSTTRVRVSGNTHACQHTSICWKRRGAWGGVEKGMGWHGLRCPIRAAQGHWPKTAGRLHLLQMKGRDTHWQVRLLARKENEEPKAPTQADTGPHFKRIPPISFNHYVHAVACQREGAFDAALKLPVDNQPPPHPRLRSL